MEIRVVVTVSTNQNTVNISLLSLSSLSDELPCMEFVIEYIDSVEVTIPSRSNPGSEIWSSSSDTHVSIMSTSITDSDNFKETSSIDLVIEFNVEFDFEVIFRDLGIRSSISPDEVDVRVYVVNMPDTIDEASLAVLSNVIISHAI